MSDYTRTDPKNPSQKSLDQAEEWLKAYYSGDFNATTIASLARLLDQAWEEGLECGELQMRLKSLLRTTR